MKNTTKAICLRFKSNTGAVLTDNQLAVLSKNHKIPLRFLVKVRSFRYVKIWFELTYSAEKTRAEMIAYQTADLEIYYWGNTEPVSGNNKLKLLENKSIPWPDVHAKAEPEAMEKIAIIKQHIHYKTVLEDIDISKEINKSPSINWDATICIEIRKYNQAYLTIIEEKCNFKQNFLNNLKEKNVSKIYWDFTRPYLIGYLLRDGTESTNHYKGLVPWNDIYSYLSSKEKNKLLKIKPVDIKRFMNVITNVENEAQQNSVQPGNIESKPLTIDSILDKILISGMASLTAEEKQFLDDASKNI